MSYKLSKETKLDIKKYIVEHLKCEIFDIIIDVSCDFRVHTKPKEIKRAMYIGIAKEIKNEILNGLEDESTYIPTSDSEDEEECEECCRKK